MKRWGTFYRVVSMVLLVALLLPLLAACAKGDGDQMQTEKPVESKTEVFLEGVLDEAALSIEKEGVSIVVTNVTIDKPTNVKISKVSNPPPLDDVDAIEMTVYDFELEGVTDFEGVVTLSIPLTVGAEEQAGAAYLNEETGEWEPVPFRYDAGSGTVQIYTDHLSKYGVFTISNTGRRSARVEFLGLYGEASDEDFMAAVEEYAIGGVPAAQCLDIGASAAGDALQLGGDFLGNIGQSAGYLAYGDDVMATLGDRLGSIGLLVSVVQIGTNIYNGKIHEAVVGSMKTAFTYVMGKVASKLSSSVMSASMAAVAIVDYAINKFGTEALAGRADLYRGAYALYYQKGEDGYKSSAYWYQTFYPLFSDPKITEDALKAEIDRIVSEHCYEFWTGTNKLGVDYFVAEAKDLKFTGGEAGLNENLRKDISAERRSILYQDILPGVFNQIALKINLQNEAKLRSEYQALSKYLNQRIDFSVKDEKKLYADHPVRFAPLNDRAEVQNWTGKFNSSGELETAFTLYGHMVAGAPNTLEIFEPGADLENDEPLRVIEFKVTPPEVEIILGEELSGLQYIGGDTSKIFQFGMDAALKQAGKIDVSKEGKFLLEVDFASGSSGSGNTRFTSEVRGLVISGSLDPGSLSGKGTFSATMTFNRKEISPMDAMEGETKEYITTTSYEDNVTGTITISGADGKVTMAMQMTGARNGFTKLQYHSIDTSGTEYWGENPTVTDKSGEITGSGSYQFSVNN